MENNFKNIFHTELIKLSNEYTQEALELAKNIDITDSQFVEQYAVGIQSKISNFTDSVILNIRNKESTYVGDLISNLLSKIKETNINNINNISILSKIPILGKFFNRFSRLLKKYTKIEDQIDEIIGDLENSKINLLKDIGMFDILYNYNKEYFKELETYIEAGKIKILELNNEIIPNIKQNAKPSDNQMTAQSINDLVQLTSRFEKKVHDLELSKTISLQMATQLRLIQNNTKIIIDKIQTSILNTIPLWKNQIIIAIGLFKQSKALRLQQEVDQATNQMLIKNSETLKQTSASVAKASERGLVEIETLKKVHADLIATLEETLTIQENGKIARRQAEQELSKIETELKSALIQFKN
ncbi:MAG: toxic anion resistance protein [Deltaproteobacteria bacterium]|jgi:uncharacterized protein YaaN involved in tellurite resistance|nr:toxic anion resistance protein [Deltaproteobacteria bacterium]